MTEQKLEPKHWLLAVFLGVAMIVCVLIVLATLICLFAGMIYSTSQPLPMGR